MPRTEITLTATPSEGYTFKKWNIITDATEDVRNPTQYCIQQQIRGEYHLGDVDLYYPGASLGIVEVDPETTDADSALHAADIAMYQEKKHKQKTPFVAHPALHS